MKNCTIIPAQPGWVVRFDDTPDKGQSAYHAVIAWKICLYDEVDDYLQPIPVTTHGAVKRFSWGGSKLFSPGGREYDLDHDDNTLYVYDNNGSTELPDNVWRGSQV